MSGQVTVTVIEPDVVALTVGGVSKVNVAVGPPGPQGPPGLQTGIIDVTEAPYNVLPGITPSADVQITQAITDAAAAGKMVWIPPSSSSYLLGDQTVDPEGDTYVAANIWLHPDVTVHARGAIFFLKNDARLPGGASQGSIVSTRSPYQSVLHPYPGYAKERVLLIGGEFDCNGNNQTLNGGVPRLLAGVHVASVRKGRVRDVTVKNLRGTLSGPPGETFHFIMNNCAETFFENCEADGSGATDTSTGFSFNNSVGGGMLFPKVHHMAHGMGITAWQSARFSIVCPDLYSNAHVGLNLERSNDWTIVNPIAGGKTALIGNNDAQNPFYHAGQETVGNGVGIDIHGCTDGLITGVIANYNTTYGIRIRSNSGQTGTGNTNTSTTITNVVGRFIVGQFLTGSGIPAGTTITGPGSAGAILASGSMTISSPATATATSVTLSSNQPCENIRVEGGMALFNGASDADNVYIEAASDSVGSSNQGHIWVELTQDTSITAAGSKRVTANAPIVYYESRPSGSGLREYIAGVVGGGYIKRVSPMDGPAANTDVQTLDAYGRARNARGEIRAVRAVTGDAAILLWDRVIDVTTLSSGITLTMPDVAAFAADSTVVDGTVITIGDATGNCSFAKPINIASFTAGQMVGGVNAIQLNEPFSTVTLHWCAAKSQWLAEGLYASRIADQPGMWAIPNVGYTFSTLLATASTYRLARFVPPRPMTIVNIACLTTIAATNNDNIDVGIFDATGARLVSSGATAGKANATAGKQTIAVSSTKLRAGVTYYAGLAYGAVGGTAATFVVVTGVQTGVATMFGSTLGTLEIVAQMAGATLPNPATAATTSGAAYALALLES